MRLAGLLHAPVWGWRWRVAIGLYMASGVPDDYQQGATVRIMFVHVPAAWLSLFAYSFIFLPALPLWSFAIRLAMSPRVAAPIGATFTFIAW